MAVVADPLARPNPEGGINQVEVRVIRFPSGADSAPASVDAPSAVTHGV